MKTVAAFLFYCVAVVFLGILLLGFGIIFLAFYGYVFDVIVRVFGG